nr:MAG TPA: hypothetical protein [Caudoviricetes sp.]
MHRVSRLMRGRKPSELNCLSGRRWVFFHFISARRLWRI